MGLTDEQIKNMWIAQQQQNNPLYALMNQTDQNTYNAALLTQYNSISSLLQQRYGNGVIALPTGENANDNSTEDQGGGIGTGGSSAGNPYTTQDPNAVRYLSSSVFNLNGVLDTLNLYDKDTVGLQQSFFYNGQAENINSKLLAGRYGGIMDNITTWNPFEPNQFVLDNFFVLNNSDGTITWITASDPTQRLKWIDIDRISNTGVVSADNLAYNLLEGLDQNVYDPNHPELIDPTWSLESYTPTIGDQSTWVAQQVANNRLFPDENPTDQAAIIAGYNATFVAFGGIIAKQWVWKFQYSNPGYRIRLTQGLILNINFDTYQYGPYSVFPIVPATLTFDQWFNKYVGIKA